MLSSAATGKCFRAGLRVAALSLLGLAACSSEGEHKADKVVTDEEPLVESVPAPAIVAPRCSYASYPAAGEKAVRSWGHAPSPAVATHPLLRQTLRQFFAPHFDGEVIRLKLSNRYNTAPVTVDRVHIAEQDLRATAALIPGSECLLTFDGETALTLGPGESRSSDPVAFPVRAFKRLGVSFFVPGTALKLSSHLVANETPYVSQAGDFTADASGESFRPVAGKESGNWLVIEALDVSAPTEVGTIVAVGDSITDGAGSALADSAPPGRDQRYPNHLARRIRAAGLPYSVVNAGISGNRLLQDGLLPQFGSRLIDRFQTDVLDVPGVTDVIVMIGSNDIGFPPSAEPSQLIQGYRTLIDRAHAQGLNVILGTMVPAEGSTGTPFAPWPQELVGRVGFLHGSPEARSKRDQVNAWVRSNSRSDGIVDFDACIKDPGNPGYIRREYNSGDYMHPNEAGYAALAECVDLSLLRGVIPETEAPASD